MEYVLITGASSGIGYELAKIYAKNNNNLILISSNIIALNKVKHDLEQHYPTDIIIMAEDLSSIGAGERVYNKLKERDVIVSVLINNAGVGCVGKFVDIDYEREEKMMILNMINIVSMTKLILKDMLLRNKGGILNVSSNGAFQPGPYISTYYATKSFLLQWSEALRMELSGEGIVVSTLCPGPTISNFCERAGKAQSKYSMTSQKVAEIAYKSFMKKKHIIIPGFINKIALIIPKNIRSAGIGKMQKNLMKETLDKK